jgi:hypothetical protein
VRRERKPRSATIVPAPDLLRVSQRKQREVASASATGRGRFLVAPIAPARATRVPGQRWGEPQAMRPGALATEMRISRCGGEGDVQRLAIAIEWTPEEAQRNHQPFAARVGFTGLAARIRNVSSPRAPHGGIAGGISNVCVPGSRTRDIEDQGLRGALIQALALWPARSSAAHPGSTPSDRP